jgi:hypothetical protein
MANENFNPNYGNMNNSRTVLEPNKNIFWLGISIGVVIILVISGLAIYFMNKDKTPESVLNSVCYNKCIAEGDRSPSGCTRFCTTTTGTGSTGEIPGNNIPNNSGNQEIPVNPINSPGNSTLNISNNNLPQTGLKILPHSTGIYLGAYNWGGDGIKAFEDAVGKKVALIGGSTPCGVPESIVENYGDLSCAQNIYNKGYVGGFEHRCGNYNNYAQEYIEGKFDSCLIKVAQNIKQLNQPMFWYYPREPSIQSNGGYGPDGSQTREASGDDYGNFGCSDSSNEMCLDGPERYRAMQQHVHGVIESVCKDCVTWVAPAPAYFSDPAATGSGMDSAREYRLYYPGDSIVDWHAIDYYPSTSSSALSNEGIVMPLDLMSASSSQFNAWLNQANLFNSTKPFMILEFGPIGANDAAATAWFNDFFNAIKQPRYNNFKAFIYWQAPSGSGISVNSRIDPGSAIGNLWKAEIVANPNFWISDVMTAGGKIISGSGGGIVSQGNAGSSSGTGENTGSGTLTCAQKSGTICSASQSCSLGEWAVVSDSSRCCRGSCV